MAELPPHGIEWVSLREHLEAMGAERDRRYAEVNVEKEKALKIKETADLAALQLAREIQTYKDEKANELRAQIERERGTYATQSDLKALSEKIEALIKPLSEYVLGQRGGANKVVDTRLNVGAIVAFLALIAVIVSIVLQHAH
jgi:hypothetical protein